MTLCPIAIVAGCKKCPAFSFCPLKTVIGDQKKEQKEPHKTQADNADKKPTQNDGLQRLRMAGPQIAS